MKYFKILASVTLAALLTFLSYSCSNNSEKDKYETRPPEESSVPFECDISTEKNIKKDDPRFGEKVIDWITECDRSSTSSTTVFVLKYVEDDNIYNYLVYRRGVECAFNTYIETLKNSLKEFLNLSFADKTVQEDYESESLTYIRYVGQREPELNIFSFTEDGSENLGYVIRTVYYEFMK